MNPIFAFALGLAIAVPLGVAVAVYIDWQRRSVMLDKMISGMCQDTIGNIESVHGFAVGRPVPRPKAPVTPIRPAA